VVKRKVSVKSKSLMTPSYVFFIYIYVQYLQNRHNLSLWFPSAFLRRLLRSDAGVAAQGCFSGSSPASPPVPTRGLLPLIRGAFWTAAWMRSAWAVRRALLRCTGHVFCMGWLAPLQPAGIVALSRCCWGRGFVRSCLPSPST
jgi:hypothetical protein